MDMNISMAGGYIHGYIDGAGQWICLWTSPSTVHPQSHPRLPRQAFPFPLRIQWGGGAAGASLWNVE